MAKYINIVRVKADDLICGHANIPYGKDIEQEDNGVLYYVDKKGEKLYLCMATSERGYKWFAYNEDGKGVERKAIINECIDKMSVMINKETKFEAFLYDATAMKYKKHPEDTTEWSWERSKIHTAPIEDLLHIRDMLDGMRNTKEELDQYARTFGHFPKLPARDIL